MGVVDPVKLHPPLPQTPQGVNESFRFSEVLLLRLFADIGKRDVLFDEAILSRQKPTTLSWGFTIGLRIQTTRHSRFQTELPRGSVNGPMRHGIL